MKLELSYRDVQTYVDELTGANQYQMKKLIFVTLFILCKPLYGQNTVKDFFKYSTIYTSGVASNPMYAEEFWYTTQGGDLFNYTEEY